MANQKISQLPTITGANMADDDKFVLVDTSGDATVATTREEFFKNTPSINVSGTVTSDGLTVLSPTSTIATLYGETGLGNPRLVVKLDEDSVVLQNSFSSGNQRNLSIESPYDNRIALFANNGDISFYEDTGTTAKLFWDASAESLALTTVGTEALKISSTTGAAEIRMGNSNSSFDLRFGAADEATGTAEFFVETGGTERMRIDSSGSLIVNNGGSGNGILKINGATGNTEAVIFQRGGTEASRIGHANSTDLTFSTGSGATEAVRIDEDGRVGIGTSSPDADSILDVQSTTKGVRFPNMTTTQKNAMGNVAGNMVFDTTLGKMCFNTGSSWETITST